jgi:hypothetical protein
MSGYVPAWILFSSSGESRMRAWYIVDGKMSDKNLEQQINIELCFRIGKCASEKLALLTLAF